MLTRVLRKVGLHFYNIISFRFKLSDKSPTRRQRLGDFVSTLKDRTEQ